MKTLYNKSFLIVAFFTLLSSISTAQISKAEIIATGLTCSMCSNAIFKQLQSLPDAANVATDLNTNTFTVTLKNGSTLTPSAFKASVEKAGFFIGSLVLTVDAKTVQKSPYILLKGASNNQKEVQIQVLDKGYVTDKEFKKLSKSLKNIVTFNTSNEDDFHIKIVN
ncbi:heavy-metal-associated domain-containing protein [Flavobacterium sp. SM2513]|uniref:heavy-metal-associated domain-containing protein n=1 Tax=Flavobacterium sp. SM2513 TaxID=3424766 RepID=UPI003D7F3C80